MSILNEDTMWLAGSSGFTGGVFVRQTAEQTGHDKIELGGNNPTNIYFYNRDMGFIGSTVLYKTTNNGENWFPVPGGGFGDMHFICNNGLAMALKMECLSICKRIYFYKIWIFTLRGRQEIFRG